MRLKLRYPAIFSSARLHAGMAVRLVVDEPATAEIYTPGSLDDVDWFIEDARERGFRCDEVPEALFVLGCYIGEVLVRGLRAVWVDTARSPRRGVSAWPMVVVLPDGTAVDPIEMAFRRFDIGVSEYVPAAYAVAAARRRRTFVT
jgi:hypothetical protein